jgi:hypothetical protein
VSARNQPSSASDSAKASKPVSEDSSYASRQLRVAEEEISSLNRLLVAERDINAALKVRVEILQQQNDALLQSSSVALQPMSLTGEGVDKDDATAAVELQDENPAAESAGTQTLPQAPPRAMTSPMLSPQILKEILESVEAFLQQTAHDLSFPQIPTAGSAVESLSHPSQRAAHAAVTAILNEIQDKVKPFVRRVNEMRRHARAELVRMRDLVVQAHNLAMEQIHGLDSQLKELKQLNASYREENARKSKLLTSLKASRSADSASITQLQQESKDAEENLRR